jgi:hypothetical protein
MADQQKADDQIQDADQCGQTAILGASAERGDECEDPVDQDEDPGDHSDRLQAAAGLYEPMIPATVLSRPRPSISHQSPEMSRSAWRYVDESDIRAPSC